ncbi:hypothetical protein D3C87_1679670 [compost metagenome]
MVVLTIGQVSGTAGRRRLEDHVDHPGNRVRAVLRRRAIGQHFDPFHGGNRDQPEVGGGGTEGRATAIVDHRSAVAAFAIDQHQHLVTRQAAQRRAADVLRQGSAVAVDVDVGRRHQ